MKRLECTVQDYAWGDPEAIPRLLGSTPDGTPAAELWMGAHPKAPSKVVSEPGTTLDDALASAPESLLGSAAAERFGQLPYLFKVLAAAQPLSIQTHPSLEQAETGFARENAAGVPIGAPNRTYRDANHKPELICALTPFAARVGFRPVSEAQTVVDQLAQAGPSTPQLESLAARLHADGSDAEVLQGTLAHLLGLQQAPAAELVREVCARAPHITSGAHAEELAWVATTDRFFPSDIGTVVALLLNHVDLEPGEAVFLPAGNLHAYLRGTGVELMANSDNVVRGGLTPKHIDIDELLAVVDATPLEPQIQRPGGAVHTYDSPVPEFALTRLAASSKSAEPIEHSALGPRIVLVTSGSWRLSSQANPEALELHRGEVVFVGDDEGTVRLTPCSPDDAPSGEAGHCEAFIAGPGLTG